VTPYAELVAATNYSFLRGASHPHEIVERAAALGHAAIGIADRNTLAGVVRAHVAAKQLRSEGKAGIQLVVGARLATTDGFEVVCHPTDRAAYGRLCRLLTAGNRRAPKGRCHLAFEEIVAAGEGQLFIAMPPLAAEPAPPAAFVERLGALAAAWPRQVHLGAGFFYRGDDRRRLGLLSELACQARTPLVATADALYHEPGRRRLADVLACIREKCTVADAGLRLEANAERHLKPGAAMARLFSRHPDAVARTTEIAGRARFSLDELRYEYPDEPVPPGRSPQEHLEALTWDGARAAYSGAVPDKVAALLRKELALIAQLGYAPYFLTVHDVVTYARGAGILCQGRGSAANSAVCYCLGITAIEPTLIDALFERFISADRSEPPDIDVDFEHERREDVIQYLYRRYGRERAAICSTVIHYRPRMAVRQVGAALGLSRDVTAALSDMVWGHGGKGIPDASILEAGLDPANPGIRLAVDLANALVGFPRHLSQHVGGFVLTRGRLDESVPILNAAMADRTNIEWDKDDIDALRMMKVDVLALGMLSCIRRSFELLDRHYGRRLTLASVPEEDPAVYAMLSKADSIGVFQVESRAQMSMLPRLKPATFYDLVIEVAIVRPGPIQGDMVHPYLRRRRGEEPVTFPSAALRDVLGRTLGVPLFQEQAMKIAIVAAGFTPGAADRLRRAMATFRHVGTIHTFETPFIEGMVANGYDRDFAVRCFEQIMGFGEYGFPESHAASFALLAYVSAWLKHHYPEVFCAALLNSQPMGFYQPAQLVRDAREHGVLVLPADVNASLWDCTLEPASAGPRQWAVRLGLRMVRGLAQAACDAIVRHRGNGYADLRALWLASGVPAAALERLAEADAFRSLGLDRREALWAVKGLDGGGRAVASGRPLLAWSRYGELFREAPVRLAPVAPAEHVAEDYAATGLSLKGHPCAFFRKELAERGVITAREHHDARHDGRRVSVAGLVLIRQQPGTAKGVVFLTLEDETGIANAVVWRNVFQAHRRTVMQAQLLIVRGTVQREGLVVHIVADSFVDLTAGLASLRAEDGPALAPPRPAPSAPGRLQRSRDFH